MNKLPSTFVDKNVGSALTNVSQELSDSVTNPALSYLSSLSATSAYGGRVGARSILERFCRHFLDHTFNLVPWPMLITNIEFTEKALCSYFFGRAQRKSLINNTDIDLDNPYYNVHIKPLREALLLVANNFSEELNCSDWIAAVNSELLDGKHRVTSKLSPINIKYNLELSGITDGQLHALESFSCHLIGDCIIRFDWHQFLYAPVVKAMMSEYLSKGIIKDGKKIDDFKPATANKLYRVLTGVAEHHWLAENMTVERLQRIKAIKLSRGSRQSSGRYIHFHDYDLIMNIIDSHPNHIRALRDKALISCLFYLGLRRQEAVNLRFKDIDWQEGFVNVIGKGNKERDVPFDTDDEFSNHLKNWINVLDECGEAYDGTDYIFTVVSKSKHPTLKKLNTQSVNDICKWIVVHGLGKSISPHDFRHTVATNLLAQGVDLLSVSKMLGHASPTTTQRYDQRDRAHLRKATLKRRNAIDD